MQIIEQTIVAKNPRKKSEDGIVVTADYIAVVDGSTSKTSRRHSLFCSNGRYAMRLVCRYLRHAPKNLSCHQFCTGVSRYIRKHYWSWQLSRLAAHPEERLTASAVVFSRVRREIWLIGDCQCLVGGQLYDNPKPYEQQLAEERAAIIASSQQPEAFLLHDTAREAIIPHMLETMKQQNVSYAVIDGFPIPEAHVRVITLDFQPWNIVLASDGYPQLHTTLAESEEALHRQRQEDPLCYRNFKATKAFYPGNNSFDDRAYIKFTV